MHRHLTTLLALGLACGSVAASARAADADATRDALIGRWDIDIHAPGGDQPSWLEVSRSGSQALVGQFVGVVGSARPISRVAFENGALRFSLPPQWENGEGDLSFEGKLEGERLAGTATHPDGKRLDWSARRAPSLKRPSGVPTWGEPIRLFNGSDLSGWRALQGTSSWKVMDGELRTDGSGANLATERTFGDFKLHVELRLPKGSNSGVYLRGRYEVQVADLAVEPASDTLGAIYGFLAPSEETSLGGDAWQTLDITLVGRRVTVAVNGKTVVCDREIPGITGGALDSDEGGPGPIMLQGDHGPVAYRNLVLTPAK
jgi:hypothetical protein